MSGSAGCRGEYYPLGRRTSATSAPTPALVCRPHDWTFPDRSSWRLGRARRRDVFEPRSMLCLQHSDRSRFRVTMGSVSFLAS